MTHDQAADATPVSEALIIDIDGFEGPLDALLTLARHQKVDLAQISILALAEQYLAFVETMRRRHLELAADYLVMAAWLAYLKSRLLLPEPEEDGEEPSAEALAAHLAFQLRRLEAMRKTATALAQRPRLDRDFFTRLAREPDESEDIPLWQASLSALIRAYARNRQQKITPAIAMHERQLWSLSEARSLLLRLLPGVGDWMPLDTLLAPFVAERRGRGGLTAASFSAALELVREGRLALRQTAPFAPLFLRACDSSEEAVP